MRCSRRRASPTSRMTVTPMTLDAFPLVLIVAGLTAYGVLGGADFGAGFWSLLAGRRDERGKPVRDHAHHAIGPVWEANHVWLIFVLVVCWTGYPTAFGSIVSTLAIPLFIAAVGIILRGTAYALRAGTGRCGELQRGRPRLRALVDHRPVRVRRGDRRDRVGPRAGRQRRRRPRSRAGSTGRRSSSACSPSPSPRTSRPSTSRPTRRASASRELARGVPPARARDGRRRGRDRAGGPARRPRTTHAAIFDGLTGGWGLGAVVVSALRGRSDDAARLDAPLRPARARRPRLRSPPFSSAGCWRSAPTCCPASRSTRPPPAARRSIALVIATAIGAVLLIPSLVILYGLLLGGRFDVEGRDERPAGPRRRLRRTRGCFRSPRCSSASARC